MYVKNLLDLYNSATPEQVNDGRSWYGIASSRIARIAQARGQSSIEGYACAAILSPGISWRDTEEAVKVVMDWYLLPRVVQKTGPPKCVAYSTNVMKAIAMLDRPYHVAMLPFFKRNTAPKTRAFFMCLRGMPCAVVDGHVANAARGYGSTVKDGRVTKAEYRRIEQAIEEAADLAGVPVHEFQAVVWVVQRQRVADERKA